MTASLSVRARFLLGVLLWTTGWFLLVGLVLTQVMFELHPAAPRVFHNAFSHVVPVTIAAVLCLALGAAVVRGGLAALDRLRERLAGVHDGRDRNVGGVYPAEVQPLVNDLNALLDHRERAVVRAIAKAGDLAHGLKTPLAILAQEAARAERAGHHELADTMHQQLDRMQRQVDYYLAHARAAASGAMPGARCTIAESSEGLARALQRLHAERGLAIHVRLPPDQVVRVQREDLDEMLGNLLDNACKWARTQVIASSSASDAQVAITIDDDGPGLDPSLWETVLQRGVRADEASAAPGSGLGLAIVRELAEIYAGAIALSSSPLGGLRATLRLPRA